MNYKILFKILLLLSQNLPFTLPALDDIATPSLQSSTNSLLIQVVNNLLARIFGDRTAYISLIVTESNEINKILHGEMVSEILKPAQFEVSFQFMDYRKTSENAILHDTFYLIILDNYKAFE